MGSKQPRDSSERCGQCGGDYGNCTCDPPECDPPEGDDMGKRAVKVTELNTGNASDRETADAWETDELTGELTCSWREDRFVAEASVFQIGASEWCCSVDAGDVTITLSKPLRNCEEAKKAAKSIAMSWLTGRVKTAGVEW